jgi:hypothetical protein
MDSIPYSSNKEYDSDSMSQPENDKTLDLARAEEVTAELGDVGKKHTAIVDLAAKAHVEAVLSGSVRDVVTPLSDCLHPSRRHTVCGQADAHLCVPYEHSPGHWPKPGVPGVRVVRVSLAKTPLMAPH